jgi:hypothetical protein
MATLRVDLAQKQHGVGNSGLTGGVSQVQQSTIARGQAAVQSGQKVTSNARPSNVQQSKDWTKSVVGTAASVVPTVANFAVNSIAKPAYRWTDTVAKTLTGNNASKDLDRIASMRDSLDSDFNIVLQRYKAGKISNEQYKAALGEINDGYKNLGVENDRIMNQLEDDKNQFIKDTFVVATLPLAAGKVVSASALRSSAALRGMAINTKLMDNPLFGKIVQDIDAIATRTPGLKQLLERNGAKFAASTKGEVQQSVNAALAGVLFKQPFIYQAAIGEVGDIMEELDKQNYNGAAGRIAFTTSLFFAGGVFGMIRKGAEAAKDALHTATYGKADVMAEISGMLKGKNRAAYTEWLDDMENVGRGTEAIKSLKLLQEQLLTRFGSATAGAKAIEDYIKTKGLDPSKLDAKTFFNDELKFTNNWEKVYDLAKTGIIKNTDGEIIRPNQIALGTFDQKARNDLVDKLSSMKTPKERIAYINNLQEGGKTFWAQNDYMFGQITNLINKNKSAADLAKAIKNVDTQIGLKGIPKLLAAKLKKDGYIAIVPKSNVTQFLEEGDTRKLISEYVDKGSEVFDETIAAKPTFAAAAAWMHNAGISTEAAQRVAYESLKHNVVSKLSEMGNVGRFLPKGQKGNHARAGSIIIDKLQRYAEGKAPNKLLSLGGRTTTTNAISDIRQLTTSEVKEALASPNFYLTTGEAKQIQKAIQEGYMAMPLELRGLGERLVDYAFRYVPYFHLYNRAQSALRYNYNPFFKTQEIVETSVLSRAQNNSLIWRIPRAQLNSVAKKLDDQKMLSTGFTGEGARDDVTLGRITASLTRSQKRNLAGLTIKMAERQGYNVDNIDDYIRNHYDEIEEGLKTLVQYPSKGWLNSPMAKTLNLAFFPMRYNLKVAGLSAKILSQQPAVTQLAVLNGLYDANKWLKSDEGLIWQSKNSEALRLLQWLTPVGSIQALFSTLNMKPDSISSMGQLGGLPAGLLFQTLDSNGVFNNLPIEYSTPYVDPKTGEVYPDKIPTNMKGRAATALTDFINSVFTYPGRTVGLPGKASFIREGVGHVIKTNSSDYEQVVRDEDLTELQRRQSELLKKKSLDEMTDDETLELFTNDQGQWSTPNLEVLIGTPKISNKLDYKNELTIREQRAQEKFAKL